MQNVLDTFSQATNLWNGFFAANSSTTTDSMMQLSSFGSLRASGIQNAAFSYSAGAKAVCVTGLVDVPVVADTVVVNYAGPADNFELTEFITDFARRDSPTFSSYLGGAGSVNETFSIFIKLCVPNDAAEASNISGVQFLTHGGTLDNNYWDLVDGYSYVDSAAERGHSTFSYDRLGIGKSDHPDPKQVVQAPLQADLAHVLVKTLRDGGVGGIKFTNVIGIGHSLGAAVTQAVSQRYPDDFDAIILTGHSAFFGGAAIGFAAAAQQIANTLPDRPELKSLSNGYYALGPVVQTLQFAFFSYPHFNTTLFAQAFKTRQTNAIGETLTLGSLYMPATAYTKPVQILNGVQDFFYCQGNCLAEGGDCTLDALNVFFPNRDKAKSEAVNIGDVGHNINFHFKRTEAFEKILTFAARTEAP